MANLINENLKKKAALVLDGAMATELEKRGVHTDNALWSATALIDDPEAVKAVHKRYFEAGADIAITDTYQANVNGFEQAGYSEGQSEKLITEAVRLARAARDEFYFELPADERADRAPYPIVAGSVGPYGAYLADGSEYTGDYLLTTTEFQEFHAPRMELMAKAGVDMFAFETQPNFDEAKALAAMMQTRFPNMFAWLSFSVSDPEHLCDGTPLAEAVAYFNDNPQISAIGVNCTSMNNIEATIKTIVPNTDKPIIVYPNNGDIYDPKTKTWEPNPQAATFADLTPKWLAAGAKIIGGCCRTTPGDIEQVADAVNAKNLS